MNLYQCYQKGEKTLRRKEGPWGEEKSSLKKFQQEVSIISLKYESRAPLQPSGDPTITSSQQAQWGADMAWTVLPHPLPAEQVLVALPKLWCWAAPWSKLTEQGTK